MTDQVEQFKQLLDSAQQRTGGDQPPKEDLPEFLKEITNEKGEPKYSSVEDALKALKASQEHISTLESENKMYKEKQQSNKAVEDILAQLDSTNNNTDDNQEGFSMEDIQKVVEGVIESKEASAAAQRNLSTVKENLTNQYGEKAQEVYANKAKDLGLSVEMLDHLATISPKAVTEYFGNKNSGTTTKMINSSVNTEAFLAQQRTEEKSGPVMFGASTADMLNSWKAAAEQVNN